MTLRVRIPSSCSTRRRGRRLPLLFLAPRRTHGAHGHGAARRRRVLAHTFLIGMQTMEAGHAPLVGTTAAISAFVWLLGLAYLYVEMTTDERAMGVFITVLLAALAVLPALNPAGRSPRPALLRSPLFSVHVLVAAVRLRQLRAGLRHRHHLRAAVQGNQGQAPGLLLRPAAVAAGARRDEPARDRGRLGLPDRRPDRRRHLGGAGPAPRPIRARRRCRWPIRRSSSRSSAGRLIRSSCSRAARSAGAAAARPISRRSASRSCC